MVESLRDSCHDQCGMTYLHVSAPILLVQLELMVKLDFLIYGACHAPFISMATDGRGGGGRRMISEVDTGV